MSNAIGRGEVFQLKAWTPRLMVSPLYAFRAQCPSQSQHVQDIPSRITVFPLSLIGIIEISIETIATNFIIKADTVVTNPTGPRKRQLLMYSSNELGFRQAVLQGQLRGNAGD